MLSMAALFMSLWHQSAVYIKNGYFCLFVWIGFLRRSNLSVISRRYQGVTGSSMLTLRVLPHWSTKPQMHDMIFNPVQALYWHRTDQFWPLTPSSTSLMLNAKRKNTYYHFFLKSLVWLAQGSNPQPPGHKADSLPTEPLRRSIKRVV